MEIRLLRYFLEIARAGNMSRAAETPVSYTHLSRPDHPQHFRLFGYVLPTYPHECGLYLPK